MLVKVFAFVSLFSYLSGVASAQKNITVNDTDSAITYENAGDALICQFNSNGTIIGGQAGCYNVLPSNCTDSVAMSQANNASASFKFKGFAIYINSLRYQFSPLYTVTLDGQSTDVDGWVSDNFFTCAAPLFSQTGLDPSVEHEIQLATKGVSPSSNDSASAFSVGTFSLISFVYTEGNGTSTNTSTSTASATDGASSATPSDNGASDYLVVNLQTILALVFAFGIAEGWEMA